jgi:hypothetical protein
MLRDYFQLRYSFAALCRVWSGDCKENEIDILCDVEKKISEAIKEEVKRKAKKEPVEQDTSEPLPKVSLSLSFKR